MAAVDRASVPAPSGGQSLPGPGRKRLMCHDGGGLLPAFTAMWRHAACTSRHMEIRYNSCQSIHKHVSLSFGFHMITFFAYGAQLPG